MKVTVTLVLDVDPDAWDEIYGTGTKPRDIRSDVKTHVLGCIYGGAASAEDAITAVTLRKS
jgi:hypothetical protein